MSNWIDIPFELNENPIDFFKLNEEYFTSAGNNVEKIKLELESGHYLSDSTDVTDLRLTEIETTLLNCQVGMGKSKAFYKLIADYSRNDFTVIVCSPFRKIVNKDYEYLDAELNTRINTTLVKGKLAHVINYFEIDSLEGYEINAAASQFSIHIMTLNCFIGNSGDNTFEQKFSKAEYMDAIYDSTEGTNVVLFIDEIHESIHNFQTEYIPKLLKWKNRIKKIFIASATFTPKVIPAINLLALITEKNVRILEADRVKQIEQSSVCLNILPERYDSSNKSFLKQIDAKIMGYLKLNLQVNVITATKALAERIAYFSFPDNVIEKEEDAVDEYSNSINLLTGDTDISFKIGQNNIGTAFKTGIDIVDNTSVLFIIFPCIMENGLYRNNYGIFSDGISSIVQAIGRMRNGGTIEMFIQEPEYKIGKVTFANFQDKKEVEYFPLNDEFTKAGIKYDEIIEQVSGEVYEMEKDLELGNSIILLAKKEFGFWYPNFHEFLLRDKRSRLLFDEPSFGKGISTYIIWALLNNQFLNATLSQVNYFGTIIEIIDLNPTNCKQQFDSLIKRIEGKLSETSFRTVINNPSSFFQNIKNVEGQNVEIRFKFDNEKNSYTISYLLTRKRFYGKQFISSLLSFYCKCEVVFDLPTYVNSCMVRANVLKNDSPICQVYSQLTNIKEEFVDYCHSVIVGKNGDFFKPSGIKLNDDFKQNAINVFNQILNLDKVHSYFPFETKNIAKISEELFLNVEREHKSRKMINGITYYPLGIPILKELNYSGFEPF